MSNIVWLVWHDNGETFDCYECNLLAIFDKENIALAYVDYMTKSLYSKSKESYTVESKMVYTRLEMTPC